MGILLLRGEGVELDAREAARWLRMAAEKNDATAAYFLGLMSVRGEGVAKNARSAQHWFQRAARGGSLEGQYMSGLMLLAGSSAVPRDDSGAYLWLRTASRRGHDKATARLAGLERRMPADELRAAERAAERMWAEFPDLLR